MVRDGRGSGQSAKNPPSTYSSESENSSDTPPDCRCKSCRTIDNDNHPDILKIGPSGVFIKIEQIRDILHTLSMKPYQATWRVILISHAHTMNPAAGNALLKVLEEPPAQTLIILTTDQKDRLLPTIVSRCQQIRFKPIPHQRIASFLVNTPGIKPEQADMVAAMSNGSISMAEQKAKGDWIRLRDLIIKEISTLSNKSISTILAFAEKLAGDKTDIPDSLDIIQSWLRDILIYPYAPDRIIHKDLTDRILYASERFDSTDVLQKMEALEKTRLLLQTNANTRLALESMLLEMANWKQTG